MLEPEKALHLLSDSAYFVAFNRTWQGIAEGAGDTNVADISRGLCMDGALARLALTALGLGCAR
jgi:hypothetical protein